MTDGPADDRPDADLLAAHVAGDPDAFATLFTRHRDRLWAVALRTMGNPQDAADGLQDGLVAAYRRAGHASAATPPSPPGCTGSSSTPASTGSAPRRCAAPTPLPDDLDEHARPRARRTPRPARPTTPSRPRSPTTGAGAVLDALATLPAEQRAALVLVDMEGYPVAEVAVMLDCAEGTVKSRCSRGRARLAALLARPAGRPWRTTRRGTRRPA